MIICVIIPVSLERTQSIIWSAIVNRRRITRSVLCIFEISESSKIQFLVISIYFHAMQVIAWLALEVIIFFQTIVVCDISVSFLNVCYVCFGPVFFCTYEECKPLINLSGSPQEHPLFDVLATPCCVHVAHSHSTHAEAFTLLKSYSHNHEGNSLCCNHTVALIHHP